jgi:hypothetical protein
MAFERDALCFTSSPPSTQILTAGSHRCDIGKTNVNENNDTSPK